MLGVVVVLTAVGGMAAAAAEPALVDDVPGLERQVQAWSRDAEPGRVLVLPAGDDPGATSVGVALGARPWVGRDSLPTSGAAATAALDDLLGRLERGDGGPGTDSALRRVGISYVLVQLGGPAAADRLRPTAMVRSALVALGSTRVAVLTGEVQHVDQTGEGSEPLIDFGVRSDARQIEIWSVPDPADSWLYQEGPIDVVGDTGSVNDLVNAGVLEGRAVRVAGVQASDPLVLSDSARRRDVDQRIAVDPYGPDLEATDPRLVVPPDAAPVTTAVRRLGGVDSVAASSSAADLDATDRHAGTDPAAAVDANVFTSWQSRAGTGVGEWWQIDFGTPRSVGGGLVQFVRNPFEGNEVTRVEVTTDQGSEDMDVPADGLLTLDTSEQTERLRLTVTAVNGQTGAGDSVGIADVTIPGVEVTDELVVTGPSPEAWVLAARAGSQVQCVPAVPRGPQPDPEDLSTVCTRGLTVQGPDTGSLERVVENDRAGAVTGQVWLRAVGTAQAAALADSLAEPSVTAVASTVAVQDLESRAQAAADGDVSTAWRPSPEEVYPTLTLAWREPADVSGVRLTLPSGEDASVPTQVRVTAGVAESQQGSDRATGEEVPVTTEVEVGDDGLVSIPTVRANQLTITFLEDSGLTSPDSATGGVRQVPIAVSEVAVTGGPAVSLQQ